MVRLVYPPFSIITHFVFIRNLLINHNFPTEKILSFSRYIDNGSRAGFGYREDVASDFRFLFFLAARFLRLYIIRVRLRSYIFSFFFFLPSSSFNGEHLLVGWFWGDSTIIFKGTMIILNTFYVWYLYLY